MGFLDRFASATQKHHPIEYPVLGKDPVYATLVVSGPTTKDALLRNVREARAAYPAIATATTPANELMDEGGLIGSAQGLIASGELDQHLAAVVRESLIGNYIEGAYLGLAEEMTPRLKKAGHISHDYASLYAELRSAAGTGRPLGDGDNPSAAGLLIWARYMFDVGYYMMRLRERPEFRSTPVAKPT